MTEGSKASTGDEVVLRLYVTGSSPKSLAARANLAKVCGEHPAIRVALEVIDVLEHPLRMLSDGIVATPSLVRLAPTPELRTIGDLSDLAMLRLLLAFPEST